MKLASGKLILNTMFNKNSNIQNSDSDTHSEVMSKLKFISKIRKGDKINVRYLYIQPDNITTKLSRTLYNVDNRINTLNFIETTIRRGFEVITLHSNSDRTYDIQVRENVIRDLSSCKEGLINIKETYIDDIMFRCKIDTFIQEIDAKLGEIIMSNLEPEDIN
jgi:hypothetical protein